MVKRQRQTPLFLDQPSPLQPCGTALYLFTSVKYPKVRDKTSFALFLKSQIPHLRRLRRPAVGQIP